MYDSNDVYVLTEYIVKDKETGRDIHKKVNLQYIKHPLNKAIMAAKVFGSWRKRGFWTDKDFEPEPGLTELMVKAQQDFLNPEIANNDKKFAEAKKTFIKAMTELIKNVEGATIYNAPVYGSDHSNFSLGSGPIYTDRKINLSGPIRVQDIFNGY